MVTYNLKSWPDLFQAVWDGCKTHDLRRSDDRAFSIGDTIRLREFDPENEEYSGRTIDAKITYITSWDNHCALSGEALSPNFCILSIRVLAKNED